MAHNRYFIINADDPNISDIDQIMVGDVDTQRYSIDATQIVIKLHHQDHSDYSFLSNYQEYNHDDILMEINTPEWIQEIL